MRNNATGVTAQSRTNGRMSKRRDSNERDRDR